MAPSLLASPESIAAALKDTPRHELIEMIVSLSVLEPLFSAPKIAKREGVSVRDVRAAIRRGEMVHPIWGPGYICRGDNSKKVPASAVNAWRKKFYVRVDRNGQGKDSQRRAGQ